MRKNKPILFLLLFIISSLIFSKNLQAQPNFINKIPIPPIVEAGGEEDTIHLIMEVVRHQFNPADPTTDTLNGTANQNGIETWCYNVKGDQTMTVLGPTLKWYTGRRTNITVTNKLPQHTTTHWHGGEVPAKYDGGPHQPIKPDSTWPVNFDNLDPTCTMWYHPHIHDHTYPQVQLGLSGMIISEDENDDIRLTLPRTYGVDDIPVIISDQGFKAVKDEMNNTIFAIDTNKAKRPYNMVNGVTNPYLEVPAHLVRLRILNGSTRKGMVFGISSSYDSSDSADWDDFTLIAVDGGYVKTPNTRKHLLTGPGARAEILVDLRGKQVGDKVYLRNFKEMMPGYIVGSNFKPSGSAGGDGTRGNAFLELRIVEDPSGYEPVDTFTPFQLEWDESVRDTTNIDRVRTKAFVGAPGSGFTIDSTTYKLTVINDTVCIGAKEIWIIDNQSPVAHPFHIHKLFFRILEVDSLGHKLNLDSLGFNGPKDDVLIKPKWKLKFLAKFDDYPNPIDYKLSYMYHCHILPHEDMEGGGMMHQFVVTNEGPCKTNLGSTFIEDKEVIGNLQIYPNPTANEVFIKGNTTKESTLRIYDLQGKILQETHLPAFNGQANIPLGHLPKGVCIVEWRSAEGLQTEKLVIH